MKRLLPLFPLFCTALLPAPVSAASCSAQRHWAPVVELYTSEGCSSCPPADAWLGSLAAAAAAHRVVPLAFHVDYWNYIGWKDPYASADYSARQRRLARAEGGTVVYTPQVRLAGEDFRGWSSADRVNERIARGTPRASEPIDMLLDLGTRELSVDARATLPADTVAYVALYERRLASSVTRGENAGRRLEHDFVVRAYAGPFAVGRDGRLAVRHVFTPDASWKREQLGVALIQADADSGAARLGVALPASCDG